MKYPCGLTSPSSDTDDGTGVARLKRRLYSAYLGVVTIVTLTLLLPPSPARDLLAPGVAHVVAPLVVAFSLLGVMALWCSLRAVPAVEQAVYWVSYPAFLGGLVVTLVAAETGLHQVAALHTFALSLPIAFVWAFLAFGSVRGLGAALGFLATAGVVLGTLHHAVRGIEPLALAYAAPIAATGTVYIFVLYAFSVLLERQTAARAAAEVVARYASHDPLTGLPNRLAFETRFEQARALARRSGRLLAVCFVDIDDFKRVNDGFGHTAGDELLKQFAERLQAVVRESDTVARIGGDEFVVLAFVDDADQATVLADKLIPAQGAPFTLQGRTVTLSCSVGVSLYPRDGHDGDTLLESADHAMYEAKFAGKGLRASPPGAGRVEDDPTGRR